MTHRRRVIVGASLCDHLAVPLSSVTAQLSSFTETDAAYVRASFRPINEEVRSLIERGILPRATYVLPDGTEMVPSDHGQLLADVGGDPAAVAGHFRDRFIAAGGRKADAAGEYDAWLSGEYGACLRSTSPESIVAKGALMVAIEALLARPEPAAAAWGAAVRAAVDGLDSLERPFADFDRERFGGPTSRDRLITATRERFPQLWGSSH